MLANVNLFDSNSLTCLTITLKNENTVKRTWLIRAQILQIFWDSVHILTHALSAALMGGNDIILLVPSSEGHVS